MEEGEVVQGTRSSDLIPPSKYGRGGRGEGAEGRGKGSQAAWCELTCLSLST